MVDALKSAGFDMAPCPLLILDANNGSIMALNDAAQRLFARNGDIKGQPLSELVEDASRPYASRLISDAGMAVIGFKMKGGVDQMLCSASKVRIEGRDAVVILVMPCPDKIVERLERMIGDLERGKYEAEFYVDLMSHDIRNYNQVSMGYIEMLMLSEGFSDAETMYLEKAQKGVIGSNKLIDDIRKVRRIREMSEKNFTRIELGDVLRKVIADAKKAHGDVKVIINENIGDEKRYITASEFIHDVFGHILENAIKYDPSPEKVIDIEVERIQKEKPCWAVKISDHGPGIPDERKQTIFERMTKTTRGMGLGLSIVNITVNKYGGSIRVEDRVPGDRSKGSSFIVELPAA